MESFVWRLRAGAGNNKTLQTLQNHKTLQTLHAVTAASSAPFLIWCHCVAYPPPLPPTPTPHAFSLSLSLSLSLSTPNAA